MEQAILVLVTCGSPEEAEAIAESLVRERLVACAGAAGPLQSIFWWQGAAQKAAEQLLIMKTRRGLFDQVARRVRELHCYEVPEVVAVPIVEGSADYLKWLESETRPA